MARIGIIVPPTTGHINPFIVLCKELKRRGHLPVFFNIEDVKEKIQSEGIDFCTVGHKIIPKNSVNTLQTELGMLEGIDAMLLWQKHNAKLIHVMCWSLPKAIQAQSIDFLLVDQSDASGGSVAEYLKIPYITIAIGNSLHWEKSIPPVFSNWMYGSSHAHIKRNEEGMKTISSAFKEILNVVNAYRKKWGLESHQNLRDIFPVSSIAQIVQLPSFLDFERKELPICYHSVGLFRDIEKTKIDFPYEKLNGKPIIYASLGTVVNHKPSIFTEIANACLPFDYQLVISIGNPIIPKELQHLPGNPLVVSYAPQPELLSRAKLCITHAGLNTVLDALINGVPLVAIPVSFDQPGTAARIKWHKLGEIVAIKDVHVKNHLKETIEIVLNNEEYRTNALVFQQKLKTLNGLQTACNIIEIKVNEIKNIKMTVKHETRSQHPSS